MSDSPRRVSGWEIKEHLRKVRNTAFQRLIEVGVIEPPEADGRWSEAVFERLEAAKTIETRTLARKAFRLTRLGYPMPRAARRAASLEVLERVRPKSAKMAQVRREYAALARSARGEPQPRRRVSYRHPLPPSFWLRAVEIADDDLFHARWEQASRWVEMLPDVGRAAGITRSREIPYEEVVVLLLAELLLRDPSVRRQLGLGAFVQH